ncbi:hypothetical protein F5Y02DRAFT_382463 [Annulohypoxylon stygium]|nr:hypothetical protein F5Y02DRAFT_382463 [Annulohypoxylon stygium]
MRSPFLAVNVVAITPTPSASLFGLVSMPNDRNWCFCTTGQLGSETSLQVWPTYPSVSRSLSTRLEARIRLYSLLYD